MTLRRIAYVVRVFPKLSESFITSELAELLRRGIEVRILSVRPPLEEMRHEVFEGAGLHERTVYDRGEFSSILQSFKPDLLHAHFATRATAVAQRLAAELSIPFTFTAHRYDIYDKPPADFAKRAADAKAVVTVSKANLDHIVKNFGVPAEKIHVIPCGVDTKRFRPNGQPTGTPEIVCVARLAQCKNQRLLLEACALLQARGIKFRCVLVGDGPCRDELDSFRNLLGLASCVEMVGAAEQNEVLGWWQRATIAVLSSESEGMPVTLMEAGACGVPVVATAVGGVPELIVDGVTGIVTPAGSAPSLAEALERLLSNTELAVRMGAAGRRRVKDQFSLSRQVDSLLDLWANVLNRGKRTVTVPVIDQFGVDGDPEIPQLARALDPAEAQRQLGRHLPRLAGEDGYVHLREIRVTRYKPGQRCLIEYNVEVERPDAPPENVVLIGKVRAGHSARGSYRLLDRLWNAGFNEGSADGVLVPEPIGIVNDFRMWLQRKVAGRPATELLVGPGGIALGRRIAEAAFKLHHSGVPAERPHTMADELRILHARVPKVAGVDSISAERIERILAAADRLGADTPEPITCGIHRDFYPDQVMVDGGRLYLVDFDLYCEGDPGLDIGNFLAHVTEQSLRTFGDPEALVAVEKAMQERFVELSGEATRAAVRAYAILTLARHVYLSTLKPERQPFTRSLLELCEERLGSRLARADLRSCAASLV
jgi:glycosyltransferase involved in cell wall biosynthesis